MSDNVSRDIDSIIKMGSIFILILGIFPTLTSAANILLLPFPWKSHVSEFAHIGGALASRGHQVHIVLPSHYPDVAKYREGKTAFTLLEYDPKYPDFLSWSAEAEDENFESMLELTPIEDFRQNVRGFAEVCYNVLESTDLEQKIIANRYDMVLTDAFTCTRCFYILLYRLGLPYISVTTQYEPWLFRAPSLPSFVPFPMGMPPLTPQMDFWERLHNAWTLIDWTVRTTEIEHLADSLVSKYAPLRPAVSINHLAGQSLLWLFDTDIAIDYPRPMMANEVNIGGLSTKPAQPLSGDLKTFVDSAPSGVILLSFGSHSAIPEKYMLKMIEALKRLPSDVHIVFRYIFNDPGNLPKNIKLVKWVPQNDVLGHNNTRLFVTHCGANGQFEALYHGVPMLSFPSFADQPYNAKRAEYHGFAETLDILTFTADDMFQVMQKMLNNPSYRQNIQKGSAIFLSSPQKPSERAAHWVEHILKFGGEHLHSAALELEWYEYLMLDILLFVTAAIGVGLWIVIRGVRLCLSMCFGVGSTGSKSNVDRNANETKKTK